MGVHLGHKQAFQTNWLRNKVEPWMVEIKHCLDQNTHKIETSWPEYYWANELRSTILTSDSSRNTKIPTSRVFILESAGRPMNTSHQPSYAITCRRLPYIGMSHFDILRWALFNLLCASNTYSYCSNCRQRSTTPYNSLRKVVEAHVLLVLTATCNHHFKQ